MNSNIEKRCQCDFSHGNICKHCGVSWEFYAGREIDWLKKCVELEKQRAERAESRVCELVAELDCIHINNDAKLCTHGKDPMDDVIKSLKERAERAEKTVEEMECKVEREDNAVEEAERLAVALRLAQTRNRDLEKVCSEMRDAIRRFFHEDVSDGDEQRLRTLASSPE